MAYEYLSARLTDFDRKMVEVYAKARGLTVSEYTRQATLQRLKSVPMKLLEILDKKNLSAKYRQYIIDKYTNEIIDDQIEQFIEGIVIKLNEFSLIFKKKQQGG